MNFYKIKSDQKQQKCLLNDILSFLFITQPAQSDLVHFKGVVFIEFFHPGFICRTHKHPFFLWEVIHPYCKGFYREKQFIG